MNARPAPLAALGTLAVALALATACSSGNPVSNGTVDAAPPAPVSCDAGIPSYANEIVPILKQDCIPCHSPGGIGGFDETTYPDVSSQAGNMLTMVVQGGMPPTDGPQLTSAQRTALTDWLECGAPDN